MPPLTIIISVIVIIILGIILGIRWIKDKKKNEEEENEVQIKPDDSGRSPIKKALLVGINKYKPELNADLQGCVNDVETIHGILTNKYGFMPENIRTIVDERATRQGILDRLKWLLDGAKAGDELVFHYSGHGSQVRDRDGDELDDQLDEILCPHDLDWDNPLTDDILAALFKQLPKGVYLTMICDACHSGSMSRNINPMKQVRNIVPPFDIRSRSLGVILPKNKMGQKQTEGPQNHVLLSGCKDNQTSADAYIDGKRQGAFTWSLATAIRENPDLTWMELHKKSVELLNGYSQIPQISGNEDLVSRKVFGKK
jgi:hypothetical protein